MNKGSSVELRLKEKVNLWISLVHINVLAPIFACWEIRTKKGFLFVLFWTWDLKLALDKVEFSFHML